MPEDGDGKSDGGARQPSHDGAASWKEIAEQVMVEKDPVKLTELCKKLNDAMLAEEREKAAQRLQNSRGLRPKLQE